MLGNFHFLLVISNLCFYVRFCSSILLFFFIFLFVNSHLRLSFLTISLLVENYLLANDDEKYDVIPEIWQGKNIADFIDPDIKMV